MDSKLDEFIAISNQIGRNLCYVQGGGGNTSIKLNDEVMAVKASGTELKSVSRGKGISFLNYKSLVKEMENEDAYEKALEKHTTSWPGFFKQRPSMESGFHALLGPFVIHTHSVYANLLCCSREGEEIVGKLFPEGKWIKYIRPGYALSEAIKEALSFGPCATIFLQNHGLIVSEKDGRSAFLLHEKVNELIGSFLKLGETRLENYKPKDIEFARAHVLFPDQVIYTLTDQLAQSSHGQQTLSAYEFLRDTIKKLSFTPNFLTASEAQELLNMDAEKYRQSMVSTCS